MYVALLKKKGEVNPEKHFGMLEKAKQPTSRVSQENAKG